MSESQGATNPPAKKENSYTYWVDEKSKSRDLPVEHQPKKIEGPLSTQSSVSKPDGPSVWNSCGTWEEKKIALSDIEAATTAQLKQWLEKEEVKDIVLTEIKLEGEAHQIFKRSKWNLMYQIKGSISFKAVEEQKEEEKKSEKKAKITLIDLTDHGDRDFQIKGNQEVKKKLGGGEPVVKILLEVLGRFKN